MVLQLVETVQQDGWDQHAMTHVLTVCRNLWTVEYVSVIPVGQAKAAILSAWDTACVSRTLAYVIH